MKSIDIHFINGHSIISAYDIRGKWKIPTSPDAAMFFDRLSDAKKWANKNEVNKENPPEDIKAQIMGGPLSGVSARQVN